MRRRALVSLAVVILVMTIGSLSAYAQSVTSSTLTATVGVPLGTRILQPVNAPAALAFMDSTSESTLFTATVIEALADGVADWYVTVKAGDFTKSGGGGSIPASALSYSGVTQTATSLGALSGAIQAGTSGALDGAGQTMFTVSGETPGTFPGYTGTYTGVGNLTLDLPAGTPTGIYTATVTVTMIA